MAKTKNAKSKDHIARYNLIYTHLKNYIREEKDKTGSAPTFKMFKEEALCVLQKNSLSDRVWDTAIRNKIQRSQNKPQPTMYFVQNKIDNIKIIDVMEGK